MAIDLSRIRFSYSRQRHACVIAINRWHIEQGQHVFLYGPSGSGKSTLLNLLAGILSPQEGEIRLLGQPFSALSSRQRDRFRARHIGVVFQQFNLVPFLSVMENIALAAHFGGKNNKAVINRAEELLEKLSLDPYLLRQRADSLSVGQQQRVAIVRALINSPEILIADEPSSALDSDTRDQFMAVLRECATDSTLIFVSHDRALANHFSHSADLSKLNLADKSPDAA